MLIVWLISNREMQNFFSDVIYIFNDIHNKCNISQQQ